MRLAFTTIACWFALVAAAAGQGAKPPAAAVQQDKYGAIFRGDASTKKLALIFTGDEYGEGADVILDALNERGVKAGFFVTGNFLRQDKLKPIVRRIVAEGHYLGPHSDDHLLYCDWDDRDRSLVTREQFTVDLKKNLAALRAVGALPSGAPPLFVAPYEWYNADQARWCREMGVTLLNFTPGSGSNRDYAREDDAKFVSSQKILDGILEYEQTDPNGLNGFLLLLHLGSGRKDPFHPRVGALCDDLTKRGYSFVRIDALMER